MDQPQNQAAAEKKWYKKPWGIVVAILFLPLFIIWYAWSESSWGQGVKVAVTVVAGLLMVGAALTPAPATEEQDNEQTAQTQTESQSDNTETEPDPEPEDQANDDTEDATPDEDTSEDVDPEDVFPDPSFGDGQHVVGTDIEAGTYYVSATNGCYWERQSDFSGGLDGIIANELVSVFGGTFIVTIAPTDAGFLSTDCGSWYSADLISDVTFDAIPDGVHLVNTSIEPGTYQASMPGDSCYWERMSGFGGTTEEIIANDLGTKSIVTISESDTGFKTLDCGIWQKQ